MTLSPSSKSPPQQRDPFQRDKARLSRYRAHRDFFAGVQWTGKPRRAETRVVVNYARALVRKVVSYTLPDPVGFEVPPPVMTESRSLKSSSREEAPFDGSTARLLDSSTSLIRARQEAGEEQANRVETLLAELLAELDADRLDFALAIDSAVLGDGVMKVTWDPVALRPRLAVVDPSTLLAWWSPDTPTEAYKFAQVELQPLVQKVKRKRRGLASLYRKRNAMLLDLMERFGAAPIGGLRRTVPVWPPILPSDRGAEARVGVQLVNARVRSRRSVAADLGEEDPDGEIARIVEEAERLAAMVVTEPTTEEDDEADDEKPDEPEGDDQEPPDKEAHEGRPKGHDPLGAHAEPEKKR